MKEPGKAQLKLLLAGLAVACIMSEPRAVPAQRGGGIEPPPPRANRSSPHPYTSTVTMDGRPIGSDSSLENWRREKNVDTEATKMLRRRAAAELAEDFDRLRRINRETIPILSSSASLDYRNLSRVSSEINGRAKRIKSNSPLALREKKGEKRTYEADAAHLPSMLPELSRLIESFLANPVFSTASVHDHELRSTAGRDLESIIRLSDTISKAAKRLARAATESAKGQHA